MCYWGVTKGGFKLMGVMEDIIVFLGMIGKIFLVVMLLWVVACKYVPNNNCERNRNACRDKCSEKSSSCLEGCSYDYYNCVQGR